LPRVSIIISAFNTEKFIRETLDSVFNQTYRDYELILINDGSTDSTGIITEEYAHRPSVRVFHQENKGIPYSFSRGVHLSSGDLVIICGSDDIMEPSLLEKEVAFYDSCRDSTIGLVYTDGVVIDDKGNYIRPNMLSFDGIVSDNPTQDLIFMQDFPMSSFLTRRAVYEKVGYYDTAFSSISDTDFIIRASQFYRFGVIPEKLLRYRRHRQNITKLGSLMMLKNTINTLNKNKDVFLCKGVPDYLVDKSISICQEGIDLSEEMGPEKAHAVTMAKRFIFNKFYRLKRDNLFTQNVFAIFGAGLPGQAAKEAAEYFGFKIAAVYDNDPVKEGTILDGLPVIRGTELAVTPPLYPILITSIHSSEIRQQLDSYGYKEIHDYLSFF